MSNLSFRKRIFRISFTRLIIAGAVLSAFSILTVVGCDSDGTATMEDTGGRMQVAETSFDFGTVPVERKVEHNYEIRNVGTGVLKLGELNVKRLEGC